MTSKQEKVYNYVRKEFLKDYHKALRDWDRRTIDEMDKEGFQGWDRFKDALMDGMSVNGYSVLSINKMLKDPNQPIVKLIEEKDEIETEGRNEFGIKIMDLAMRNYYNENN